MMELLNLIVQGNIFFINNVLKLGLKIQVDVQFVI